MSSSKTWPQYVASLTATMAVFCSGIHMAWPSPTLPRILSEEYPFNVSSEEGSYIVIIGYVGDIIGNILFSVLMDLIGRKVSILLLGVPQIISMAMIYLSNYSVALLYVARPIGGIPEGGCFTILPIYICELAEPKIRGMLGSLISLTFLFGFIFTNLIGSYFTIYTSALVYLSCSVLFMICFRPMPESPYYLIMKNKIEEARSSLKKLRACEDVEDELLSLTSAVTRQMSERGRFRDLIEIKSNRMVSIFMIVLRILQQFSGAPSFTLYTQMLFKNATNAIPEHWCAIIFVVFQAVATLGAIFVIDVVGRKPMILVSVAGCFFTLTFNAIFFSVRDFTSADVSSLQVLPLIVLILFIGFFAIGLGSAGNLLAGELFPTSIKAKAVCMANILFAINVLVSTKFYQYMVDNYSIVIPFAVFALIQLLGFVYCVKYAPETKNKTLEQIQQVLKGKNDVEVNKDNS